MTISNQKKLFSQIYKSNFKKIIKKIITDKKKILILSKKKKLSVLKIYMRGNTLVEFKNEVRGYKYFYKKKIYNIPKLLNYSKKNSLYFIELEFINGKKANFFDFDKIFKLNKTFTKKSLCINYIENISRFYQDKKKLHLTTIQNNIKKYLKKNFFQNYLRLSFTHGDLAPYNCLKKDNYFYVYDFEKFKERIFLFDHINWMFHPIISNISLGLISDNFKYKNIFIINIFLKYFKYFIYVKLNTILRNNKIDKNEFTKYYLLYLYEKLFILLSDLKFINNSKNKILTKKMIVMVKKNISNIIYSEKF
jgi:hypothetical protein